MVNILIRRAGIADVKELSALSEITFKDAFGHSCPKEDMDDFVSQYFSEGALTEELSDPNDFYFLAEHEGKLLGYMRLKEDYTDYPDIKKYRALELKRIYVLKEYQSYKVGSELLSYALNMAHEMNYEAMWLGVWEFNDRAKTFYERWGFNDTGHTHPFYIGNTGSTDHWYIKMLK